VLVRVVATLSAGIAFAAAPAAHACGPAGYSYAGVSSRNTVSGVGAALTSLAQPAVQNGHVAGWVGVGGPGLGPGGSSEWIQVGYSGFPGPTYHEVSSAIRAGATHRVAVLEVRHRTNWWRVWVDGHAVSRPYHLPGSHGAWRAIATAENWGGGSRACNLYSYRFNRVAVARHPGGTWKLVDAVYRIHSGDNRYVPASASSFVARTSTLPNAPKPQPKPPRTAASYTPPSPVATPVPVPAPATPPDSTAVAPDAAVPADPNAGTPDDPAAGPGTTP